MKLIIRLMIFTALCFVVACDTTIEPIAESDPVYSMSGPLDLQRSPNYIRVHNVNSLLNPETTRELDVQMVFTNLTTMESELLRDSVVVFDNLYTHNFKIEKPIEFNTRYRIDIEDDRGFRDSLISVTTKESQISVSPDSVECGERFYVELTNIDLDAGERLDAEVAVQVNNNWIWTPRSDFYEYNSSENLLVVGWSPNSISQLLWPPPTPGIQCRDFSAQKVRFRFTHIGYVEGADHSQHESDDFSISSVQQRNVLSRYSKEAEIIIDDEDFDQ
ncbi:MAG: hypothetical protein JJU37_10190 [Balneolaceae bacterium]|nr:hypothetical protein [Balneolaceae bacterium]